MPAAVVRFHRGLRNQTAAMDVAKATFPHPQRVTVAGSSAGGVGAAGFAPFLARFIYGNLIVTEHGLLNDVHPDRYKRFIVEGDTSHTALQTPLFYSQDANGVLLNEWTEDFLMRRAFWADIVEDALP